MMPQIYCMICLIRLVVSHPRTFISGSKHIKRIQTNVWYCNVLYIPMTSGSYRYFEINELLHRRLGGYLMSYMRGTPMILLFNHRSNTSHLAQYLGRFYSIYQSWQEDLPDLFTFENSLFPSLCLNKLPFF